MKRVSCSATEKSGGGRLGLPKLRGTAILICGAFALSGCGNAYSGLSDAHGLGAAQYVPAVDLVASGKTAEQYSVDLPACRQIAAVRQATASQQAQEDTAADALDDAVRGAAAGYQTARTVKGFESATGRDFGSLADRGDSAAIGAGLGLLGTLGRSGKRGQVVSAETRAALLNCLRGRGYSVVES